MVNGTIACSAEAHTRGGLKLTGDNNPSKRPEVRARIAASVKAQCDPITLSKQMRDAYAEGKIVPKGGRCKWYDHVRPDGSIVKLQGTWEVALARRLDALGVIYNAHEGRWRYTDLNGNDHSYYPDFYIPMWDTTIDVKGVYWDNCGAEKFDAVRGSNPERVLVVATRDVLESWGVNVTGVQSELLKEIK